MIRAIKCNGDVPLLIEKREITNLSRGKLLKRRHNLNQTKLQKCFQTSPLQLCE